MQICIAGDSSVAAEAIVHVRAKFPAYHVSVLASTDDRTRIGWQNTILENSQLEGLDFVDERDICEIADLIFVSLNHPINLAKTRFQSKNLFKVHFSLLPKYRGYHTASWPILNGDLQSGTTLCVLDSEVDLGDIIAQNIFYIYGKYTAKDLHNCHVNHGIRLFKANLESLVTGNFTRRRQPVVGATFYASNSLDFEDIKINFHATAHQVSCQFRAYIVEDGRNPTFESTTIFAVEILGTRSIAKPGTLVLATPNYLDVTTIDNNIRLFKSPAKA